MCCVVHSAGDGDGDKDGQGKDREKEKEMKRHHDPFEKNGGKSIPLQLKALNECLLGTTRRHNSGEV